MNEHNDHKHHGHTHIAFDSRWALAFGLLLTAGLAAVEFIGGLLTGSVALLADAVHMLSDSSSMAVALVAVGLARLPSAGRRTFGLKRAEIVAAFVNGCTLVLLSGWIVYEAVGRLREPTDIRALGVMAVAAIGLLANLVVAAVLSRGAHNNLNVQAALRHVLADALGSIGVVISAVVVLATGWVYADPLVSIVIAGLIVLGSWSILRDSAAALLEIAPRRFSPDEITAALAGVTGVVGVHDLHVWTITSSLPVLSAHVMVSETADCHAVRRQLQQLLRHRFALEHTTLQVDHNERDCCTTPC